MNIGVFPASGKPELSLKAFESTEPTTLNGVSE